ncbi:MAG: DUF3618 domain-containing protein [Rhodospirillales bacterium]
MKNYRDMSPDEIEQDIAGTRAHIDRTLDVLTARLSPSGLLDQALRTARDTGGEFTLNLGRTIRENPVPSALVGLGLGWLILAGRSSSGNGGYIEHGDDIDTGYEPRRRYQVSSSGLAPTGTLETSDLDVPEDWSAAYDDQPLDETDAEGRPGAGDRVQAAKAAGKDAYEQVREGASGARSSLAESAKRGGDVARDAAERAKLSAREVRDRASSTGRKTSERAREMAHGLSDRASATAARAKLYGSSVADRATDAYRRGGDAAREASWRAKQAAGSAGSFAREHPIAVGLGIAAIGAAIAAFLPRTRREDELMGDTADELKAAAREQAEIQAERARDAAAAAIEAGKEKAREAGLTPEGIKEKLNETAAAAAGVAKSAAEAGAGKAKEAMNKPSPEGDPSADKAKPGKSSAPGGGSEAELVKPAIGEPTPSTPTGGIAGVSGISTPPTPGAAVGSTMDSHPGKPAARADDEKK